MSVLAGDVGGTKTILAIFDSENCFQPIREEKFQTNQYNNLEAIFTQFLADSNEPIESVCVGMAGPVLDGHIKATNINWEADEKVLSRFLKIKNVKLINDLQAMAFSIPILRTDDIFTIYEGEHRPHSNIALLAPGTGLGESYLFWDGSHYHPISSEGGHTDFAPKNEQEIDLLRYLLKKYDHVSYERIASGMGICEIFEFLSASNTYPIPEPIQQARQNGDLAAMISNCALGKKHEICVKTMDIFVSTLANEASNLALRLLSFGGVYLGGGIPPKILPLLHTPNFIQNFKDKGRLTSILERIPVRVILNAQAGLIGAARYAVEMIG